MTVKVDPRGLSVPSGIVRIIGLPLLPWPEIAGTVTVLIASVIVTSGFTVVKWLIVK